MYQTGSASTMGTLRRDYVARIPIDLDRSSVSSAVPITSSAQLGTARILIRNPGNPSAASVVRCRLDSDNSPCTSLTEIDRSPDPYVVTKQPEVTLGFDTARKWSSSDSRETGSILKKPDFSSETMTSDRSKRTPQGRRKVRFTNNVAMYRFDSDGVDSAHSSSECERLYAPTLVRKAMLPNRYGAATVATPGNSSSPRIKVSASEEYDGGGGGQRFLSSRRIYEDKMAAFPPAGHQQGRSPKVFHGTPNGSLYLRNNFDRASSLPSVQWLGSGSSSSSSTSSSLHKPSASLRSTSYAFVSDALTHEKRLVISAKLSDTLHPNDITIKANKSGSKIRIVSSKDPSSSSSSSPSSLHHSPVLQVARHQISEQIILPVQVDPYRLTARLDANGSLLIEAPCIT